MNDVVIKTNNGRAFGILINGIDLSTVVRGYTITEDTESFPEITLNIACRSIRYEQDEEKTV